MVRSLLLMFGAVLLIANMQDAGSTVDEAPAPPSPPSSSLPSSMSAMAAVGPPAGEADAKAHALEIVDVTESEERIGLDGKPLIATSSFAGRSVLESPTLSPDGSKFAFVSRKDGKALVIIVDAETREPIQSLDTGTYAGLNWYRWAGNDRILFSRSSRVFAYLWLVESTQLRVFDLATKETHLIGFEKQGLEGDDVLHVDPDGRHVIISLNERLGQHPSVYRFPLDGSGEDAAVLVQKRRNGIDEWWADSAGNVRLGMRLRGATRASFYYRSDPTQDFEHIAKVRRDTVEEIDHWDVIGLRPGSDIGYAVVRNEQGRRILTEFDFSTGEPGKVVYENPDWDVDGVSLDPSGAIDAVYFTDDMGRTHWMDESLSKTEKQLQAALGEGSVRILSRAANGRMIVWHGSAADPGVIYVYRPAMRQLDVYAELRPELDYTRLATPKAISYTARDGTPIRGYLTLPPGREPSDLPLIVMPHGGPYGVRDSLRYDDQVQFLASRGYAVIQPNFRGSGGYGQAFEELGDGQIGRKMQDDLDDAMDWAVTEGIADKSRVCLVGGSYGGFAAMWGVLRNPERYRCAASWAGVTDFESQLKYDADTLYRRAARRWKDRVEGDEREFDLDDVSPSEQAERLQRPLLLAHGTADDTVPFDQYERMKEALEKAGKSFDPLVIKGEGHSFSKPENEQSWYDALETFLAKNNPAD